MPGSDSAFTGSIPESYDRYLGPLLFEDYAADLARRTAALRPRRVLETAAGTGIATRALRAQLAPEASLVATDLNAPMLEIARAKLGAAAGVELQVADACKLPFPDAAFDAVVSQFGAMFFPDKPGALREAARVLVPGGSLLFNVWDSLEHNDVIRSAEAELTALLGGKPEFFATPYGWGALDPWKAILLGAGFDAIQFAVERRAVPKRPAREVALGFLTGTPFSAELARRSSLPANDAIERVTRAVIRAHGDPLGGATHQAIVITARRA